jgi:spermidine/putrescine transport system permease protein
MRTRRLNSPIPSAITVAALLFLYAPLVVVVLFSFHSTASLSFPFQGLSTRWYREVLSSSDFRSALTNSLIVATVTTLITLCVGTAAAAAISRIGSTHLRAAITALLFIPITLPGVFLGVALLVYFHEIKLSLSLTTVTIAHVIYVIPYFLLIARAAFERLDPTLDEAAQDLGASGFQVFRKVTFPQIYPLLIGAAALAFALSFDEFIITFYVIGPDSTLPMFIWSSLKRTVDPSVNVISTILLCVSIILWIVTFLIVVRSERRRRGPPRPINP